ncbi:MAG: phosphatidate cytidylyltransferase [bacterium]
MLKEWKRYLTGILLIPITLGIVYFLPDKFFLYLILVIALFSFAEYLALFDERKHPFFIVVAVIMAFLVESIGGMGAVAKISSATIGEVEGLLKSFKQFTLATFSAVVLIPAFSLYGKEAAEIKFKRMLIYFFGFFYLGITFGLFPLVRSYGAHHHWLALALITPWVCDTAAYFGGRMLGKRKFAPQISPKKTWEGALSGALFSVVTGVVFYFTLLKDENIFFLITLSFLIGVFGQTGDLVESLVKRGAKAKDSGKLFPGHGGLLDRTDSLIVSVTVVFIALLVRSYVS